MQVYDSRMPRTSRRELARILLALPLIRIEAAPKRDDLARTIARLREVPLSRSDEPDLTFSALTKRW